VTVMLSVNFNDRTKHLENILISHSCVRNEQFYTILVANLKGGINFATSSYERKDKEMKKKQNI
jgi:hypothetical protein